MTKAHIYKRTPKEHYYIDSKRVSRSRYDSSLERASRVRNQSRIRGKFAPGLRVAPTPRVGIVPRPAPAPPTIKRYLIRGTARPKRDTNARTDKLVSDHFFETEIRIGNIDEQEEKLNEKYSDWVHFDTYIEEIE